MNKNEIWKDVVGFEGLYKVSNKGNIYSVERKDTIGRKCGGRTLKPKSHQTGYLNISLYKNGVMETKWIHRLVLEAFVTNLNNYPEVNHKDENKTNNELTNLEWCTSKYNNNYGERTEKVSRKLSKKVRAVNIETGEVITFSSTLEAGNKGYPFGSVAKACRGTYGRSGHLYKGHRWSYEY